MHHGCARHGDGVSNKMKIKVFAWSRHFLAFAVNVQLCCRGMENRFSIHIYYILLPLLKLPLFNENVVPLSSVIYRSLHKNHSL